MPSPDQIVLNKIDLVSREENGGGDRRHPAPHPLAPIHPVVRSESRSTRAEPRRLDLASISELDPEFLRRTASRPRARRARGHDHGANVAAAGIRGVSLSLERPLDGDKVTAWLNRLLAERGPGHPARQGHPRRRRRSAGWCSGRAHDLDGELQASLGAPTSAAQPHGHRPRSRRGRDPRRLRSLRRLMATVLIVGARARPGPRSRRSTCAAAGR